MFSLTDILRAELTAATRDDGKRELGVRAGTLEKGRSPTDKPLTHWLIFGRNLGANCADLAGFLPPGQLLSLVTSIT
jgi:hypothetical protein